MSKNEKDLEFEELEGDQMPIWQPQKVEDILTGVIVDIEKHDEFGLRYQIKTAEDQDLFTPFHKLLQDRMSVVEVGNVVKIIYKGSKPSRKGNPLQLYKVYRAKP